MPPMKPDCRNCNADELSMKPVIAKLRIAGIEIKATMTAASVRPVEIVSSRLVLSKLTTSEIVAPTIVAKQQQQQQHDEQVGVATVALRRVSSNWVIRRFIVVMPMVTQPYRLCRGHCFHIWDIVALYREDLTEFAVLQNHKQ